MAGEDWYQLYREDQETKARYNLSLDEARRSQFDQIYKEAVRPSTVQGVPKAPPGDVWAVYVTGQPGSGKTTLIHKLRAERPGLFTTADHQAQHHPHYSELRQKDDLTAREIIGEDIERWMRRLIADPKLAGYTVYREGMHTSSRRKEEFKKQRELGRKIAVEYLAVPKAVSQLGLLSRYQKEASTSEDGKARYCEPNIHDKLFALGGGVTDEVFTEEPQPDRLTIRDRHGRVLWEREGDNVSYFDSRGQRVTGQAGAQGVPTGAEVVAAERERKWTKQETLDFAVDWSRLAVGGGKMSPLTHPALRAALDRARELAAPHAADGIPLGLGAPLAKPVKGHGNKKRVIINRYQPSPAASATESAKQ